MASHKIAFFATCDDNYVKPSITALKSVQRFHPEYDYFIIGNLKDENTKKLIKQQNISFIYLDLHKIFHRKTRWPSQCFWIFKGPEIFFNKGYKYSCSIDGDTLCLRPLTLNFFERKKTFDIYGKRKAIDNKFNSGVLFYNNVQLQKQHFFSKVTHLYNHNHSFKGDQCLLNKMDQMKMFKMCNIGSYYNLLLSPQYDMFIKMNNDINKNILSKNKVLEHVYIVHFIFKKPWSNPDRLYPEHATLDQEWQLFNRTLHLDEKNV